MFAAQGLKLLPEVELNSNDLLIDLAEIGLGIACIPDYMLRNRPGLEPVHLKTPLPARSAVIAHHEALQLSQAAQCFLKYFPRSDTITIKLLPLTAFRDRSRILP